MGSRIKIGTTWGQYARAPAAEIFRRNQQRLQNHINGNHRLTDYFLTKVNAGIRNYNNHRRAVRLRRRHR